MTTMTKPRSTSTTGKTTNKGSSAAHAGNTGARSTAPATAGRVSASAAAAQSLRDRATNEPTNYPDMASSLDAEQLEEMGKLTPFARELQYWLWSRPGPPWTRLRLSKALNISESTINAWFNRGTLPDPRALRKLWELTEWREDHLLALAQYDEMPPAVLDQWDFARARVADYFDLPTSTRVTNFLNEMQMAYEALPKRAGRPKPKKKASTSGN